MTKRTFRNWPSNKPIPPGMEIYNRVWVIPADLDIFMPPDEVLDRLIPGEIIYKMDGIAYDIFNHQWLFDE